MNHIKAARAIGGLLSIITLLSMVFLDFWVAEVTLSHPTVALLLTVISGLLGVDIISEYIPDSITVTTSSSDEKGEDN